MTDLDAHTDPPINTRPKLLTLLAILVFVFSIFQIFVFGQVLYQWELLAALPLSSEPILLAGSSLMWGITGIYLSFSLWTGKSWARIGSMSYWTFFSICSWIRLVWIVEPTTLQSRWPVNLVITVIGLGSLFVILSLKSTRSYFKINAVKIP